MCAAEPAAGAGRELSRHVASRLALSAGRTWIQGPPGCPEQNLASKYIFYKEETASELLGKITSACSMAGEKKRK